MQLTADSDWEPLGYNLFPDYGEWGERRVAAEERREKCHPMLDFFFPPSLKQEHCGQLCWKIVRINFLF